MGVLLHLCNSRCLSNASEYFPKRCFLYVQSVKNISLHTFSYSQHFLYGDSTEAYTKPGQTSKIERFLKIVNGFQPLTIFAKCSFLDVQQGPELTSAFHKFSVPDYSSHRRIQPFKRQPHKIASLQSWRLKD